MPAIWRFVLTMRLCLFLGYPEIFMNLMTDCDTDITSVRRRWRLITLASIIWMSWLRVWCAALARAWGFLDSWTGWLILFPLVYVSVIHDTFMTKFCSDLRKLGMNLIPFPRVSLSFCVLSLNPRAWMMTLQKSCIFSCQATRLLWIQGRKNTKTCLSPISRGRMCCSV